MIIELILFAEWSLQLFTLIVARQLEVVGHYIGSWFSFDIRYAVLQETERTV